MNIVLQEEEIMRTIHHISDKVDIIIPTYNVEQYLHRCVDSVLNQTYKDIEVIHVDDGSTDECPAICDEYARHDSRVTALHKKNGGLSSARNWGLNSPQKGNYVTFIDSADWIENDTIEYCVNLIKAYDADVVEYCCKETRDYKEHVHQPKEKLEVFEGKAILEENLRRERYSVCMCFFKRDLFDVKKAKKKLAHGLKKIYIFGAGNGFIKM